MEVSGQLHVPAALPPGKEPQEPIHTGAGCVPPHKGQTYMLQTVHIRYGLQLSFEMCVAVCKFNETQWECSKPLSV